MMIVAEVMGAARKRKAPAPECDFPELPSLKGEKMDMSKTNQCLNLLRKLMEHQFGWVFNQPVDPVQLNIPDYFSIIKKPMDLGTVKEKLLKRKYASTGQFSSDVRLTFANAMLYNPPTNEVHIVAKTMSQAFDARWRLLEDKWAKENPNHNLNCVVEKSREEKRNPISGWADAGPPKKKVNLVVRCAVNAKPAEPSHNVRKTVQGSSQASHKGEGADKPQSCIRIEKREDNGRLIFKFGSSNRALGANSDRSNSRDSMSHNSTISNKEATVTHQKQCSMRSPMSDKRSALDGTHGTHCEQPLPCTSSANVSEKEVNEFPLEEPLSPSRALRAAMLKSRFADTIVKAQQRALLDQGKKVDPAKLQLEREKLERRQQEEKARIEAKVHAAQVAARRKAEEDRKMKRQKEREAARLALQQIKKTVDLDNSELLKELEKLNFSWTGHMRRTDKSMQNLTCGIEMKSGFLNPLEKLGLFIKEEEFDDDDFGTPASADMEEGEIFDYS